VRDGQKVWRSQRSRPSATTSCRPLDQKLYAIAPPPGRLPSAMSAHSRVLRGLPLEVCDAIQEYASDRVTCRAHESALISALAFRPNEAGDFGVPSTVVDAPLGISFSRSPLYMWRPRRRSTQIRFQHNQFNEHNFPLHFGIDKIWPTLREQDETEAMGAEDTRLYPRGCVASAQPHGWGWL